MSVSTTVAQGESGRLRLYTIDTATQDGMALRDALKTGADETGPLAAQALGAARIDPWWLTLVPVADIRSIGFATYLRAGHDVPDSQLAEAKSQLDAAIGTVVIVQSPAFGGAPQTLQPAPYLIPLAEFDTIRTPAPVSPTQADPLVTSPPTAQDKTPAGKPLPAGAVLIALLVAALLVVLVSLLGNS